MKVGRKKGGKNRNGAISLGRLNEYWQEYEPKKYTYHTALKIFKLRGIPMLSLCLVLDVFDHQKKCKKKGCGECAENREWVLKDDPTYVFSFVSCVERAGMDVVYVRERYRKVKEEDSHGVSEATGDVQSGDKISTVDVSARA